MHSAARAWLAAEVKKVPYEYKECNLSEKEDFFKSAYAQALGKDESNVGKVPIWKTENGEFIAESAIVARYIDHFYSDEKKYGKPLLPKDAFQRAAVEVMVDWFGDSGWIKLHYGVMMQCDPVKKTTMVKEWKGKWKILNQRLSQFSDKGLYLPDGQMSLFECIAYPFIERLCVIEEFAKLDLFGEWMNEFPRIKSWYDALVASDAVKAVKQEPQYLITGYAGYRKRGEDAYAKEKSAKTKAILKSSGVFVGGIAVGALSAAAYFGKLKK